MLEWMQRHKKWLVIVVWISAFALIFAWYLPDLFGNSPSANIGKVGDRYISRQDYDNEYNVTYKQVSEMYPGFDALNVDGGRLPEIENLAFERLSYRMLLQEMADDFHLVVAPNEVANYLVTGPYKNNFVNNFNQFDPEIYKETLKQNNIRLEKFEEDLARDIEIDRMQNFANFPASNLEVSAFLNAIKIKDNVSLNVVNKDSVLKNITIALSDNDIRAFWEANKAKYIKPSSYKLAYIAINADDIPVSDSNIERFYKENSGQYGANALQTSRDEIIADYKKDYVNLALSQLQNAVSSIEKREKIYSNVISGLNADSINILQNALENGVSIESDSIPISFVEIDDNDFLIYQNLLLQLSKMDGNNGNISPVFEEGSKLWIIPYLIEKTNRRELSFEEAKDMARDDLRVKKEVEQFKIIVNNMLKDLNDNDFSEIGEISLASAMKLGDSNNTAYTNMANMGLNISQMQNLIAQILSSKNTKDVVYVDDNKAIIYRINNQKLPSYDEIINATNAEIDQVENEKQKDMRNVLLEYGKNKYKIIDYRRQN